MTQHDCRALATVAFLAAVGVWAGGCGDGDEIGGPPPPPPPPGPPVASDPVPAVAAAAASRSMHASADSETAVVYISLPPGSAPEGRLGMILNQQRPADTTLVPVAEGGFDPAAVTAVAGDVIVIKVFDGFGSVVFQPPVMVVAARRPPIVVRTNPPPRKRDVPLNSHIVIVFSEPIDSATLTNAAIQLRAGSALVPGRLAFRDADRLTVLFIPAAPLSPATSYILDISETIRDLDGDALATPVSVEFTTATSAAFEEYFVDSWLPFSGGQGGDSILINATVRVMDGNGTGIEGAVIRFRASVGTVEPDTTTSGLGGITTLRWSFPGILGIIPPPATAELSACASNSTTRCDFYWSILVIGYDPP